MGKIQGIKGFGAQLVGPLEHVGVRVFHVPVVSPFQIFSRVTVTFPGLIFADIIVLYFDIVVDII